MEKVLVTGGPFAGLVGCLVDGSVTVEIFGRLCNAGCPAYIIQDTTVNQEINPIINDRVILEVSHGKHGFYA